MKQTVWLARHANRLDFVNPDWFLTAPRRYDPPLSDDGLVQAEKLAQRLASENIDGIFVSPFLRTLQTARPIATVLNLEIKIESGLSEWLNPDWMSYHPQTVTLEELNTLSAKIDGNYTSRFLPQYPETETEALSRAALTVKTLADEFSGNILLIGHGASVAGCVLGLSPQTFSTDIKVPLCSLFKFTRDSSEMWNCELKADTSHLNCVESEIRLN